MYARSRLRARLLLWAMLALLPAGPATPEALADLTPHTLVVFGDSQAQGVAVALRRLLRSHDDGWHMQDRTRPGTSIGQPAGYDWPAALQGYASGPHAALVVVMIGGNDRLPIHLADGSTLAFRSEAWRAEYGRRVRAMLHSLQDAGIAVLWLGNPVCREPRYSADMRYLNGIVRDALAASTDRPAPRYVSLWSVVADQAGGYVAYAPGPDGATERMRLDDGIHFTPAGYDLVAARVMQAVTALVVPAAMVATARSVP